MMICVHDVCRPFYAQYQHRQNIKEIPTIDVPTSFFHIVDSYMLIYKDKVERQMEDYVKYLLDRGSSFWRQQGQFRVLSSLQEVLVCCEVSLSTMF